MYQDISNFTSSNFQFNVCHYIHIVDANTSKIFTRTSRCASTLKPYLFNGGPENPGREQNVQQIGVNRPATSILNARFIVWRQTPARYNWPLIRVRQKVNSSFVRPTSFSTPFSTVPLFPLDPCFAFLSFIHVL